MDNYGRARDAHDDSAGYHDVRIKAKTLCYTIELAARFIEIPTADAFIEWVKESRTSWATGMMPLRSAAA